MRISTVVVLAFVPYSFPIPLNYQQPFLLTFHTNNYPQKQQVYEDSLRFIPYFEGSSAVPDSTCQKLADDIMNVHGGSTVDAAITASLCSGVINSYASGIGGGAFMLVKPSKQNPGKVQLKDEFGVPFNPEDPVMIDCREVAPAASTFDMFNNQSSVVGGLASGVPGELHCFETAWKSWGKLPWAKLFEGPINLARDGFKVPPNLSRRISYPLMVPFIMTNPELRKVYAPNGLLLKSEEICKRLPYAKLLHQIATEGINAMYKGPIARSIVKTIRANGGIMSFEDFENYKPVLRRPLVQSYKNHEVTVPTAPGGGPLLLSMLNILENYDISESNPASFHLIVEAIKFAVAEKTHLGDPQGFPEILDDVKEFVSKAKGIKNAEKIDKSKTFPAKYYGQEFADVDEHGTCHISVLGTHFNRKYARVGHESVSITSSVNFPFGSQIVDPDTNLILNNQMADFSIPGITDRVGNPTNPRNYPGAGRRPLSSMTPTIAVAPNGDPISIGASGGGRIFSSVLQSLLYAMEWNYSSPRAVSVSRVYPPLTPNVLEVEDRIKSDFPLVVQGFQTRGHELKWLDGEPIQSVVSLVQYRLGKFDSAVDPRLNLTGQGK